MATYKPLQSIATPSATTSITFSGIDQNYTDLVLIYNGTLSAQEQVVVRFNGSSASNYSFTRLSGNGVTPSSDRSSAATNIFISAGNVAELSSATVNINNYSNTTTYKTLLSRWGNPSNGNAAAIAGTWRGSTGTSTEAITSITVSTASAATFAAGSTFDLYGIKSGAPQALGGDVVTTDGNYWYHAFTTTGALTFTAQKSLSAEYLVVAGGGAGGNNASGGGGAGGLLYNSTTIQPNQTYIVTVGAGGANTTNYSSAGLSGTNSSLIGTAVSVTATGGGGGAGPNSTPALVGGSGGGASGYSGVSTGANGTTGQGNKGGNSPIPGESGGGGGAGGNGGNGGNDSARSGVGGVGLSTYSAWGIATSTGQNVSGTRWYAGGGGGGAGQSTTAGTAGGSGGGGTGAGVNQSTLATAGTANTGGGGGGTAYGNTSGSSNTAGGSGIVIVRYPV